MRPGADCLDIPGLLGITSGLDDALVIAAVYLLQCFELVVGDLQDNNIAGARQIHHR